MRKLWLALALALVALPAGAQQTNTPVTAAVAGAYNSSPPTITSGQFGFAQIDSAGRLIVNCGTGCSSGSSSAPISSSALAANTVIKSSAGSLASFQVAADSTLSGAAWWIMIYNAASAPSDGAVTPIKCYAMTSGVTSFSAGWSIPVSFSTGIVIGVSTTGCFTKTASTHAFISGDIQ